MYISVTHETDLQIYKRVISGPVDLLPIVKPKKIHVILRYSTIFLMQLKITKILYQLDTGSSELNLFLSYSIDFSIVI